MDLRRFTIFFRTGRRLSVPYYIMPVVDMMPEGILYLKAPGICITIVGRNLGDLEKYFIADRIIWIKESLSGYDTEEEDLYIDHIQVKGKMLKSRLDEDEAA